MSDRARLERFIAKYSPAVAKVARAALGKLRAQLRGTQELVYDNYNALAIAWSPTGRTSDVICSIALYPRWVSLFFMRGAKLADPDARLKGSGKQIRHVVLESAKTLDEPAVRALLRQALSQAPVRPTGKAAPVTVVRAVAKKQRPRRAG